MRASTRVIVDALRPSSLAIALTLVFLAFSIMIAARFSALRCWYFVIATPYLINGVALETRV
ncbi:hypothetical protein R0290_17545 [Burkholderia semiarida]|uniref:hypothetical protein n=1 Tax=Burkholderia sp. AU44665 TaxID=3059203 RepID=UPI00265F31D8|nr:hypothetical protein [Burkholderia sp. AU44665]MDN7699124.1 hypothetical protein [Burkholderia sp. AU44665]